MAERTLRDLIAPGLPQQQGLDLGRVKRNVGKMVEQGAPEDEIDAYIAGEGTTVDAIKAFKPQKPDVGIDMAKAFSYGANEGIDSTLNLIGAPIRAPINFISRNLGYGDVIPELELARRANDPNLPMNEGAGPAETTIGRIAQAVGEAAGATALPSGAMLQAGRSLGSTVGLLGNYARTPTAAAALDSASAVGSGLGIAAARENDLGMTGELGLGLLGGFAGPNALNMASRTYGGVRAGLNYGNRMVERARNPEAAAYRDVADTMVRAGLDPADARRAVAPPRSQNLNARGFTDEDLADIISRQLAGANADDVVQDFRHLVDAQGRSLTGDTARAYLRRYQDANPTPMNIIDIAKETRGSGNALPLSNLARADMAIADDPVAAERLISRQRQQPGRTADIIEQSGVQGRNMEEELQRIATAGRDEEIAAYGQVRQQQQPVHIEGVIRAARGVAANRGGEIGNKLNDAVDLFFQPELRQKPQAPATLLRITEQEERIQRAIAAGRPGAEIARMRRRLWVMRQQDQHTRPLRDEKVGTPVTDVGRYIDARQELDQMIQRSMQDGRATPLTEVLTRLRTELNTAARRTNPALRDADATYSENRSIEALIRRGGDIGNKLTPQTRHALREFRSLTPTRQEVMRVAFENRMASDALGTTRGHAAADRFQNDAFDQIIDTMYPRPRSGSRGEARAAEQAVFDRGQALRRNLRREAITTETTRDALRGSRTAALQDDMAALMEGPRTAADMMTGRWSKVLENLSNRLTRQIGQRAAQERIRILTTTDPAEMLPMLNRLAREAATAGEREVYRGFLRDFARVGRRQAAEIGAISSATEQ